MKSKYGLKAMVHLASMPEGRLTLAEDIARTHAISKKFLDTILGELRKAGFVQARKGRNGGYELSRSAADIRVGNLLRVLDGPLAPIGCASRMAYRRCDDCVDEQRCHVRLVMLEVRNAIAAVLDNTTLEQLRAMPSLIESGETEPASVA